MHLSWKYTPFIVPLMALVFGGCAAAGKIKPRETNAEVMLISFGETDGELKDCGCRSDPKGGLSHRATLIDSLRAGNLRFVTVDAGNFLNTEAHCGELKSRYIWKAMEEMGYFASSPGTRELSAWNLYRELAASSSIRSIATNLSVVEGGNELPAGLPFAISEIGELRVAFFSLIDSVQAATATPPEGVAFRVANPAAIAAELVPRLREKADLVVLLSQLTPQETDLLLKEVPGIDVAVYGHQPGWVGQPKLVGSTITQQTGTRGMYVGELLLVLGPAGEIVEWGARNGPLGGRFREQAEVSAEVAEIERKAKELVTIGQQNKAAEIESKISHGSPIQGP